LAITGIFQGLDAESAWNGNTDIESEDIYFGIGLGF
jgi:hypothetical protein